MTTQKGNIVYVHVLDWPDQILVMPKLPHEVKAPAC